MSSKMIEKKSEKLAGSSKLIPNVIPHAGMRPDSRRKSTGAAQPDDMSVMEEIEWRVEHQQ